MTDREKLFALLTGYENPVWIRFLSNAELLNLADYLIANGVTVQEPVKKAEDCRCYTKTNYGGACLGTKEIDPCKGDGCERWKPKEEQQLSDNMIEIPRSWFPDSEMLRPYRKSDGLIVLYDASNPLYIPDERYVIFSAKDAYEVDALRAENRSLLEKADLEAKLHAKTANGGPVAEVSRAGVCELCGDGAELIKVNDHNLVSELEKAVEQMNPDCDHRGAFAARVTIFVELLGDI